MRKIAYLILFVVSVQIQLTAQDVTRPYYTESNNTFSIAPILPIKTVSDTYTTTTNDYSIIANKATAFTVTLHTANTSTGQTLRFNNYGAGTLTITGDIQDAEGVEITTKGSIIIQSNGSIWTVFAEKNVTYIYP